jgi:hypothetical protein
MLYTVTFFFVSYSGHMCAFDVDFTSMSEAEPVIRSWEDTHKAYPFQWGASLHE